MSFFSFNFSASSFYIIYLRFRATRTCRVGTNGARLNLLLFYLACVT